MASIRSRSKRRAAAPVDDVPLLVRVLGGNPVTSVFVLSCLNAADTRALRRLHVAVAGAVAGVPWADTDTIVVDAVRWRAALPAAVGARLSELGVLRLNSRDAAATALAGVSSLDLSGCHNVTDELFRRLPTSLRTLNVGGCDGLAARASFAHLTTLASLDCSDARIVAAGLPPSLQKLHLNGACIPATEYLVRLSQLRVLHARGTALDAFTLACLPPGLVELNMEMCYKVSEAASFAHLPVLQALHAAESSLCDAALATLPPSLVQLNVAECTELTDAAVLSRLPALRLLDVNRTDVGDALVGSLPAGLEELHMVSCRNVTARATLGHWRGRGTGPGSAAAGAPAVGAACRARGCAVPAAGAVCGAETYWAALAVLADGRLAIGDDNGDVWLWDVEGGGDASAALRALGSVRALAALPDGRRLAVSAEDDDDDYNDLPSPIEVWDVVGAPHTRIAVIPCDSTLLALVVLADGRLAAGCADGPVSVVDVDAGTVVAVLEGHTRPVLALAALPSGALASGSEDGTVRVWDVGRKVCVVKLEGHTGGVQSLAVLADGRLAGGTGTGMVVLWDVGSRTFVGTLNGHSAAVAALVALPDGRLVSGCKEGVVQLWDTRAAAAAAMAGSSRAAGVVPVTVLVKVPRGSDALVPLPDGRLACACSDISEVFRLEVPPPATYE